MVKQDAKYPCVNYAIIAQGKWYRTIFSGYLNFNCTVAFKLHYNPDSDTHIVEIILLHQLLCLSNRLNILFLDVETGKKSRGKILAR